MEDGGHALGEAEGLEDCAGAAGETDGGSDEGDAEVGAHFEGMGVWVGVRCD